MIQKLRRKFVCINMLIVTAMLLAIFAMVLHFTMTGLKARTNQTLRAVMEEGRGSFFLPGQRREELQLPHFYVTVGSFGEISVSGGNFGPADQETLAEIVAAAKAAPGEMGVLRQYGLNYYKRASSRGLRIAFVDVSGHELMLKSMVKACAGIGSVSFLLFLGISILLSRWAVSPVERAWNQQRQFVADASHELKTPLAVIMTNAELLTDPKYQEAERAVFTASVLAMAHQMRGLVENLLEMARADNAAGSMAFSPLDFSELLEQTLLPFEPVFFENGLTLESRMVPGVMVKGSASHLKRAAEVLLDNAGKYTTPGGTVTVSLRRTGNLCLLRVAGPGEAISREDLKNIFKRFYRIDKARTRDGSFGLGLSIAHSIVTEHGGKIWAESTGGENAFFIQLPLTREGMDCNFLDAVIE